MIELFAIAAGSFVYRFRGGLFNPGNFLGWFSWAVFCGAVAVILMNSSYMLAVAPLAFAQKFMPHRYYYDFGHNPANRADQKDDFLNFILPSADVVNRSFVCMTIIGWYRCLALLPFALYTPPSFVCFLILAGGVMHANAYYIGHLVNPDKNTIIGEWVWGGMFVFLMVLAMLGVQQ